MNCPSCAHPNVPSARFCESCGGTLDAVCSACGAGVREVARFCQNCGAPRETASEWPPGAPSSASLEASEPERRQITVVFSDLVGSTALSQILDAEEMHEVVREYQRAVARTVEHFGGEMAQFLGDGVLVHFGYPTAHEDDPVRALSAALEIAEETPRVGEELAARVPGLREHPLAVRLGVHTGAVVVARRDRDTLGDQLAWGDTVNIAARIQGLAKPGAVFVSAATRRLARGAFEFDDQGEQELKGIAQPVPIFRVVAPSDVESRFARHAAAGLAPFVGREAELERLGAEWSRAEAGAGRALVVSGDAGLGKSRLLAAFRETRAGRRARWLTLGGSALHQHSALHPMAGLLRRELQIADGDPAPLARLENALESRGLNDPESRGVLADLLAIPVPDGGTRSPLAPEVARKKLFDVLGSWLLESADGALLAMVIEDAHWLDPSTLEFLGVLLDRCESLPVLLLLTTRTESDLPWEGHARLARLPLRPLPAADTTALVRHVTGSEALSPAILEEIVGRADGVPLFAEELTKSVVDAPQRPAQASGPRGIPEIPATLRDSLAARLDQLGPMKSVAQVAAILGREFEARLLGAVAQIEGPDLGRILDDLERVDLVHRPEPDRARYAFRHALFQDAAYDSVLRRRRLELHARTAHALGELFPEVRSEDPEYLARHCEAGGLFAEALEAWRGAAECARASFAMAEEIHHLKRALGVLHDGVPEGADRDAQEIELRVDLGKQLISVSGLVSREAETVLSRARELCVETNEPMKMYWVLLSTAIMVLGRSENDAALGLARELERLAAAVDDPDLLPQISIPLGGALGMRGELEPARRALEEGAAAAQPDNKHLGTNAVGVRIMCQTWAADNLWLLGHPDRARELTDAALSLARTPDCGPAPYAQALVGASTVAILRREPQACSCFASELVVFSGENGLPFGVAHGTIALGWAQATRDDLPGGIATLQEGLALLAEVGTSMKLTFYLALLAEALENAGRFEEAEETLEKALRHAQDTGESFYQTEILRLRGQLIAARSPDARVEAETYLREALEVARAQDARLPGLRAATALSRLLGEAPCPELAEAYGALEEGFDLIDLAEARAQLST